MENVKVIEDTKQSEYVNNPDVENTASEKPCHIERQLIPVKISYFCQYFVISTFFLYVNPILVQSGLTASHLGLTAFITNALATCARLISGPIMDRTKNKNRIIIGLSLSTAVIVLCFLALPHERRYLLEGRGQPGGMFVATVYVDEESNHFNITQAKIDRICWPSRATGCFIFNNSVQSELSNRSFNLQLLTHNDANYSAVYSVQMRQRTESQELEIESLGTTILQCSDLSTEDYQSNCVPIHNKFIKNAAYMTIIMGLILRTLVACAHAPVLNLLESITFGILGPKKSKFFGQSRLFGSLGYIVGALVTGAIINMVYRWNNAKFARFPSFSREDRSIPVNYMPSIIMGAGFALLGALSTAFTVQVPSQTRLQLHKAILVAFQSSEMIKCLLSSLLTGFSNSLIAEYFTLILTTQYQLSHSFLGALISMIAVTEVPIFFITGWLVTRFGPTLCVSVAHFIYAIYFAILAFESKPWALLLAQALSGLAFPIAYNAILHQAGSVGRDKSLGDGSLVASMQAIATAILFGVTQCFGGFVWGFMLHYMPGRHLFAVASCYTGVVMLVNPLLSHGITKVYKRYQTSSDFRSSSCE